MASRTGPHICQHCGDEFMGWSGNPNKYCGRKCSTNATKNGSKYTKKERPVICCDNCGISLSKTQAQQYYSKIKSGRRPSNKYCSRECMFQYHNEYRECDYCGESFYINKSDPNRFCSRACNTNNQRERIVKKCRVCGDDFYCIPSKKDDRSRCKRCKHVSLKREGSFVLTQEEYKRALSRFRSKQDVKNITDNYIDDCVQAITGKRLKTPNSFKEYYRSYLKLKRTIKEQKQ